MFGSEARDHGRRESVPLHYCGAPLDERLACSQGCEARDEAWRDSWREQYQATFRDEK